MKKYIVYTFLFVALLGCNQTVKDKSEQKKDFVISKKALFDKIKGGWAGQTIGCTFGGPTEFKFKGSMIQDYQPIIWYDNYIKEFFEVDPGLYDDVYMDFTFIEIIEKLGVNAPVDSFAEAFAKEKYKLWHANQAARYNILNGIKPPASGNWKNNPHADDIDFQIEADFAGLMSPGMINTSSEICDRIGHIMNYGDGYYGGLFVASMLATAFVSDDIDYIISQGLKPIPEKSKFYQSISDIIKWHKQFPNDWKQCWFEFQKKNTADKGCPEGVFDAFTIDANVNAAHVVMGLLYGNKDFYETMNITARCGDDADSNPATSAGILGTILGYDKIPAYWKPAIEMVQDVKFPYLKRTLNEMYNLSFKHALAQVSSHDGIVKDDSVTIKIQQPEVVKYEESFEGIYPVKQLLVRKDFLDESIKIDFTGTGIVVAGNVKSQCALATSDFVALLDVFIDGAKVEQVKMPYDFIVRKYDIFYKYLLTKGDHKLEIKWTNPNPDYRIYFRSYVVYSDEPVKVANPETVVK